MFTDRKRFSFRFPGSKVGPVTWVTTGSKRQAVKVSHPMSINIYAGITLYGVTRCHVVAGSSKHMSKHTTKKGAQAKNITASEYAAVLKSTFLPDGDRIFSREGTTSWVLQQDNDPSHRGASSIIEERNRRRAGRCDLLDGWPANSPDLNLIENLWSLVQARVDARGCKTFAQFSDAVLEEMRGIKQEELAALFKSMHRRLQKVINLNGDKTGY